MAGPVVGSAASTAASGSNIRGSSTASDRVLTPGSGMSQHQPSRKVATSASTTRRAGCLAPRGGATDPVSHRWQQEKLRHHVGTTLSIPEALRTICPDLSNVVTGLMNLETSVDEATESLLTQLKDTYNPCLQAITKTTLPLLLSRRYLRVYIYNTYEHQPPPYSAPELHAPLPLVSSNSEHSYEATDDTGNLRSDLPKYASTHSASAVHLNHPLWTLHIKGQATDRQMGACRLGSFFERILVAIGSETVVWDSRSADAVVDELVITRKGDVELPIKLIFFPKYASPLFSLSPALSTICGGQQQLSVCSVLRCIFSYALAHDLLGLAALENDSSNGNPLEVDESGGSNNQNKVLSIPDSTADIEHGLKIKTDAQLRVLLGANIHSFGLRQLPQLLRAHLLPPKPIVISHHLRLAGDWIETEHTYDFTVDCVDSSCASNGENLANGFGSLATTCCSLGLDGWLAGGSQHPLNQQQQQCHSLDFDVDDVGLHIARTIEAMRQRLLHLNLYRGFARDPIKLIQSQLAHCIPDHQRALADENFLYEYEVQQRLSTFYKKPWVPRAVSRYLQRQAVPLEDQVCKVLASFNIPDPRKRHREGVDGTENANGSKSSKPRTISSAFTPGTTRSRPPQSKPARRKEEATTATASSLK